MPMLDQTMSQSDDTPPEGEREFAFGMDHFEGQACPAQSAGRSPSDSGAVLRVAEHYDFILEEDYDTGHGRVPEAVARSAWLEAIEEIREMRAEFGSDHHLVGEYDDSISAGREIACELGWLDDE